MATIKFFTRTKKGDAKVSTIYLRLKHGKNVDLTVKSGIQVRPQDFNNKSGTTRNIAEFQGKDDVDKRLRGLKNHILDEFIALTALPTKVWLTNCVDSYHNPNKVNGEEPKTLFWFIQDFIDKAPTRPTKTERPACYKQIREYNRSFHYLKEFAKAKKRKIDFEDITLDFYQDYLEYLQSLMLSRNTVGKKIQTLKIFLNAATDFGHNKNMQFRSKRFIAFNDETDSIHLNEDELQAMYDLDLSNNERLEKVRDMFIVGCWTGLRFGDWHKVTPKNIKGDFLEIRQGKTKNPVVIPLLPFVTNMLEKYDGKLPRISGDKTRDYIKEVGQLAKITEEVEKTISKGTMTITKTLAKWELIGTHTGRRSFATNMYHRGVPTLSIMAVTGHKTESAFLKYIKVSPQEHAKKMLKIWQENFKLRAV